MERRIKRVAVPVAMPAMAPALNLCFVWLVGVVFVFVADSGRGGEWSMVTMIGAEFAGDNVCATEKFPRSKSTKRYASWKNARPSVYWSELDARRKGK